MDVKPAFSSAEATNTSDQPLDFSLSSVPSESQNPTGDTQDDKGKAIHYITSNNPFGIDRIMTAF